MSEVKEVQAPVRTVATRAVKVTIQGDRAFIVSKDKSILDETSASRVIKRFSSADAQASKGGTLTGFFKGHVKSSIGVLELGERVADEDW